MSEAGKRLIEGAQEAVAFARGDKPAASITVLGFTYRHVPDGSRILAPDQLDPYTIERCAEVAEDHDGHFSVWGQDSNTRVAQQTCADIAAAIRALGKGDT